MTPENNLARAIITSLSDGLLVFDKKNKLSFINPQAEKFLNIRGQEVLDKSILELSSFGNFALLVELLGGGIKKISREELSLGEYLILEVSTIPMAQEEEKIGNLVILHDVSREKMVERMKTEFVSLTAHQLRTPLSAIKWTLRMILDGDLGEVASGQREFLEKTYQSNERMIRLINDLLNVTMIEEGRYLFKPILAHLEKEVQFVVDSFKEEIKRRKIKLRKSLPELPAVMLDVEKMRLAIANLLDNALRYTFSRGEVMIALRQVNKEIEFSIKDSGVGIPENQQKRVFSKFFRGANVIRMETEGTGLGLFITKNIIEAHGGRIWFESEEGRGTTFYFTLPIREKFGEFLTAEFYRVARSEK